MHCSGILCGPGVTPSWDQLYVNLNMQLPPQVVGHICYFRLANQRSLTVTLRWKFWKYVVMLKAAPWIQSNQWSSCILWSCTILNQLPLCVTSIPASCKKKLRNRSNQSRESGGQSHWDPVVRAGGLFWNRKWLKAVSLAMIYSTCTLIVIPSVCIVLVF